MSLNNLPRAASVRKRRFWKCAECREHKRRCDPERRDWEDKRERCQECIKHSRGCGPMERHNPSNVPAGLNIQSSPPLDNTNPPEIQTRSTRLVDASSSFEDNQLVLDRTSSLPSSQEQSWRTSGSSQLSRKRDLEDDDTSPRTPAPGSTLEGNIRKKLSAISTDLEALEFLQREYSAFLSTRPLVRLPEYDDPEFAISSYIHETRRRIDISIGQILERLDEYNSSSKENLFRWLLRHVTRYRNALKKFLSPQHDDLSNGLQDVDVHQRKILVNLIHHHDGLGEHEEAMSLRRELETLKPFVHCSVGSPRTPAEASVYQALAASISNMLSDLRLPHKCGGVLGRQGFCPPAHLAFLLQRGHVVEYFLQQQDSCKHDIGTCLTSKHGGLWDDTSLFGEVSPLADFSAATRSSSCHVEARDLIDRTLIHLAAADANNSLCHTAVHHQPQSLSHRDVCGLTPAHLLAANGNLQVLKFLETAGANFSARDLIGRKPVSLACEAGHLPVVLHLLDDKHPEGDDPFFKWSSLHAAAASGDACVVKKLLEKGHDPCWPSSSKTAAQVAFDNGHLEAHQLLQEAERRKLQQQNALSQLSMSTSNSECGADELWD